MPTPHRNRQHKKTVNTECSQVFTVFYYIDSVWFCVLSIPLELTYLIHYVRSNKVRISL